jgi:hypothetical protein
MSKRPDVGRQALAGTAGQLRDAWSLFGEEVGGSCISMESCAAVCL